MQVTITVYGLPAPQGSKRHVGNGVMIESSKKVKPWREAVKWAGREAITIGTGNAEMVGAVSVKVCFTLPKPKSARKDAQPSKKPDLDKLVRSTFDALSDAGVWRDDAQVVSLQASKVYPNGLGGLGVPGAIIIVSAA